MNTKSTILVALFLAACGGSQAKTDSLSDPQSSVAQSPNDCPESTVTERTIVHETVREVEVPTECPDVETPTCPEPEVIVKEVPQQCPTVTMTSNNSVADEALANCKSEIQKLTGTNTDLNAQVAALSAVSVDITRFTDDELVAELNRRGLSSVHCAAHKVYASPNHQMSAYLYDTRQPEDKQFNASAWSADRCTYTGPVGTNDGGQCGSMTVTFAPSGIILNVQLLSGASPSGNCGAFSKLSYTNQWVAEGQAL